MRQRYCPCDQRNYYTSWNKNEETCLATRPQNTRVCAYLIKHDTRSLQGQKCDISTLSSTGPYPIVCDLNRAFKRQVSSFLRSTERILFTSFFSPAGFTMSRGYWSRMVGHFRLKPPSWTDWHTWPQCHAGIDPMPDKMNSNYLKLLYCEFQNYEVMTMSVEGGHRKKYNT